MAINKCRIKKDDKVKVISGKDKGKIGKILKVFRNKNRVVIENINILKYHQKPNPQAGQGGIVEKASPINISNIMLMCSKCLLPVRVKMQRLGDGKNVRVCRKCKEIIDV